MQDVVGLPRWQRYFDGFTSLYHFYGPEDYETWLAQSGFRPRHVELIPVDIYTTMYAIELKGTRTSIWFA